MKKRILSCALTLVMLLSLMPTTAFAAEKHHTYYSKKFEITGNQAVDICNVAKAQKGKTEAQLHYNGAKWCASFVGDCARLAGIPQSVIPEAPLCDNMYQGVMNGGGKEIASLSKCQPGDLVFYKNPPGSDRIYCHVAIIISNKAGEKNSIHGNLLESGTYKVYQMKYTGYTDLAGNPYPAVFVRPAYKNTGSTTGTTTPSTPSTDPAKTYTVRYNANGGSGTMKDTKVTYGTATTLTANAFTRSGYDFVGWFAQRSSDSKWGYKNGSSTKWFAEGKQTSGYYKNLYANKGSSSNATSVNGDVVTLYAQWVKFGLDTSKLEVSKSQAHVYTSLKKPAGVPISQAGIYLWEEGKTQPTSPTYKESYSSYDNYISKTSLPINYVIGKGKEVNVALKEGTTYNYKIVCTAGKASLTTETGTFTTPGTAQSTTPVTPPSGGTTITAPKTTSAQPKKVWDFLYAKLGNEYAVAGVMGNLKAESSLLSINLQNSFESKLGYTDNSYTDAVDKGTYSKFSSDSAGYGLAQWTYSSRKAALLKYAHSQNASIGNLDMQLNFLWKELSDDYSGLVKTLKKAESVQDASDAFLTKFEKPKDQSESVKEKRAGYGQTYYDKYATGKDKPSGGNAETEKSTTYTVRYNANGGSGTMKDTKVTYGTATTLTANTFTRSGYDFVGWFAQRSSDGKWGYKNGSSTKWFAEGKQTSGYYKNLYGNKGSSSNATSVNGDVVTLYAQWVKFGLDTSKLEVSKSQAHVYTSLKKPAGVPISQAGIYLWEKGKTQPTSPTYKESYSSYDNYISKTSLPINYTIGKGKEVNVALKEGTTYNYKIVCTAGKASLTTETGTFTTPGTPTVPPESGAVGGIVADMNEIILKIGSPKIWVNGTSKVIDDQGTTPVIRSSRTLLPVRAVFEAMGGTVGWDNDTRTVSLELNGKTLYLQIDNSCCKDSLGKTYTLDSPPAILNSRTMLPIRFVVEYFGGTVDWDGGTQSVIIQYEK